MKKHNSMKKEKEIVITFNIYQDTLDNQNPDLSIFFIKPFTFTKGGSYMREIKLLKNEIKDLPNDFGVKYIYRITESQFKTFLDFRRGKKKLKGRSLNS